MHWSAKYIGTDVLYATDLTYCESIELQSQTPHHEL